MTKPQTYWRSRRVWRGPVLGWWILGRVGTVVHRSGRHITRDSLVTPSEMTSEPSEITPSDTTDMGATFNSRGVVSRSHVESRYVLKGLQCGEGMMVSSSTTTTFAGVAIVAKSSRRIRAPPRVVTKLIAQDDPQAKRACWGWKVEYRLFLKFFWKKTGEIRAEKR
ncbi:unnamed protein product [Caenorhabditis brenneri]